MAIENAFWGCNGHLSISLSLAPYLAGCPGKYIKNWYRADNWSLWQRSIKLNITWRSITLHGLQKICCGTAASF